MSKIREYSALLNKICMLRYYSSRLSFLSFKMHSVASIFESKFEKCKSQLLAARNKIKNATFFKKDVRQRQKSRF